MNINPAAVISKALHFVDLDVTEEGDSVRVFLQGVQIDTTYPDQVPSSLKLKGLCLTPTDEAAVVQAAQRVLVSGSVALLRIRCDVVVS